MRNNLPKRILIADDQFYSLEGLKLALAHIPDITVCGEATDGIALIDRCTELLPDMVITDLKMPGITGMEAISIISTVHPDVKSLAWTQYMDDDLFRETMKAGARGFLYKSVSSQEMANAINRVMRGHTYYCGHTSNMITEMIKNGDMNSSAKPLPPGFFAAHEREVLIGVCRDYNHREIAAQLGLSPNTINKYRANLKFKTGADGIAGLIAFAVEYGVIKPEEIRHKKSPSAKRAWQPKDDNT